ncbi:heme-dependent oxidative N-demethylase subunit alpha family protein [Deinococcus navajonensis]|uniref:Heme-dependent oxidative N-demethylase subunit alpha family protein n=1 Tax=Deinococcus navajonensis TaxID=309884 RepID=A0ABV8XM66_9DEIO
MRPPAVYRPFLSGSYSVSAGLFRLGTQAVPWREDGQSEAHTFALDHDYPRFVASKVAAHRRALHEYAGEAALSPALREAAVLHIAQTLAADSAGMIHWDGRTLRNEFLGWAADLEPRWGGVTCLQRFAAPLAALVGTTEPLNALDFLGLNMQEDLALIARGTGGDWVAATHVLSPQHWDPRDKLGRDFVAVHAPVAGSGPMNATAPRLVDAVINRGPFVRFAWGLSLGDGLDHHPAAPPDADRQPGTAFDPDLTFLRVERQTLTGFAAAQGALFTIRPLTTPLREAVAVPGYAAVLAQALRSMTPEQVRYKGLGTLLPGLLPWLDAQPLHSEA